MERGGGSNTKVLKMMNLINKRKQNKIRKYKLDSSDSSVGDSDQSSSSLTNRNRHEPLEQRKFCAGRKSMYEKYWKTQKLPDEQQDHKKPTMYASTPMVKRKPAPFASPNVTPIVNLKPPTNENSPGKESASLEFVKSASSEIPINNSAQKSDRDSIPERPGPYMSYVSSAKLPLRNSVENAENIEPNCDKNECAKCGVEKRSFGFNTSKTRNQSIGVCTSPPPAVPAPICHSVQVGTSAVINHSIGINTSRPKKQSIATNTSRRMKSVGTNTTNVGVAESPVKNAGSPVKDAESPVKDAESPVKEVTYNSHNYESFSGKAKSASRRDEAHDSPKADKRAGDAASKILNASGKDPKKLGQSLIKQIDNSTAALGKVITRNKEVLENVVNEKSDVSEHSIQNITGRLTRSRTQNLSSNKPDCTTPEADIFETISPGNRSEEVKILEPNKSDWLNRSRTQSFKKAENKSEEADIPEPNSSGRRNLSRIRNLSLKKEGSITEGAKILEADSSIRLNGSRTRNLSLKKADSIPEGADISEPNSSGRRNRSRTRNLSSKKADSITEGADILEPNSSIRLNGSRTRNLSLIKADSTNQDEKVNHSLLSTSRSKNNEDQNDLQRVPDIEPYITPFTEELANEVLLPEATEDTFSPAPEKLESGKKENNTKSPLTTKKSKRNGAKNGVQILQSLHFVPEPVAKKLEVIVEDVEAGCIPDIAVTPATSSDDSKTGKETTRSTRKRGRKAAVDVEAAKDASVQAEPVPSTSTTNTSKRGKKSKDLLETLSDSRLHKVSSSSSFKSRSSTRSTKSKRRRAVKIFNESFLNLKGTTTRCGRQVKPTVDPALEELAALAYKSSQRVKRQPSSVKRKNQRQDRTQTSKSKSGESVDATNTRQSQDSGCFLKEDESATIVQSKNVLSGDDFAFVKPTGVPKRRASKKNETTNDRASTSVVYTPSEELMSEAPTVTTVSRRRTNKINFPIKGSIMDAEFFSEERPPSNEPVRTCCVLKSPLYDVYDLSVKPKMFFDYTFATANTFYTLMKGEAEVRVHDSRQHLNEGDWFEVPKGIEYFVKNAGDETMHMHFYSKK